MSNIVQVTSLTRRVTTGVCVESICEKFVIGKDMEKTFFQEVTKVLNG